MLLTYKYKLQPNKGQVDTMLSHLETYRHLYNEALAERKTAWEERQETITLNDQKRRLITESRHAGHPFRNNVPTGAMQQTLMRLQEAYNHYFRRVKQLKQGQLAVGVEVGYPQFKKRGEMRSWTYNMYNCGSRLKGSRLYLQGIGDVKIRLYRPIPDEAEIRNVEIVRDVDTWWAHFLLRFPDKEVTPSTRPATGIDVGIHLFVTDASGNCYMAEKHFAQSQEKLAALQRESEKYQRGSWRKRELYRRIGRLHQHIRNQRKHWHIQTANHLLTRYGVIYHEKLAVKDMIRRPAPKPEADGSFAFNGAEATAPRRKGMADAGWYNFFLILTHQGKKLGATVQSVDPCFTTQRCSKCGELTHIEVKLTDDNFVCTECGHTEGRKTNAAKNVLYLGQTGGTIQKPAGTLPTTGRKPRRKPAQLDNPGETPPSAP